MPRERVGAATVPDESPAESATQPSTQPPAPVVTHKTVRVRERIPFGQQVRRTDQLDRGERRIGQPGRAGTRVRVVRVTLEDGVEVAREIRRTFVARRPAPRVTLLGTYVAPPPPVAPAASSGCDPNYSGCVPVASDVDCAGGSGNGPAYASGVVQVLGYDIYDLDADGDGYGCD
ncbi:hypothetical protein GCM10012276_12340 [Nocardioides deserti]|nr:hypothetical protein GCM10012276_12340 [Nocardioides deserti]